ncbi:MAG: FAD-binding protein [Planctomycetia bacterium]|nr:FAD-binding protein [Planctomycetia bacterium]
MNAQSFHTLIIGTGAAGLAAAIQLHRRGVTDILLATESLQGGTSINTGSDKQTYYKLSLCGREEDSIRRMAETYFQGGSMHGDLALVEAATSVRAFMNLVELGLPFPKDRFGQYVGYKTDHDPCQRATSIGPYTSREMCRAMIREVGRLGIPVREGLWVKELLVEREPCGDPTEPVRGTVYGATFFRKEGTVETILAQNVIFATGGPGGLYADSVYPNVHVGAIGVALRAGAVAQNLPESQFGMASTRFRWNVSGSYMQVLPRLVSTAADGISEEREVLAQYESFPGEWLPKLFLKGYQWPFDARKVADGSSRIDLAVYVETVLRKRRVWLDYRQNPTGFSLENMGEEAREYLRRCGVENLPTPLARLQKMNPQAVALYAEHGIDLTHQRLEIAVCAQHNNGGLAADEHWESVNLRRLFPIGEVNGSHGVYRPGGSALNAGQVGAIRTAERIARQEDVPVKTVEILENAGENGAKEPSDWREARKLLQQRSSRAAGFLRHRQEVEKALEECRQQTCQNRETGRESCRNSDLLLAQEMYLDAIRFQIESGVGSRGSALVLEETSENPTLTLGGKAWNIVPENADFRTQVLESWRGADGQPHHRWLPRREIPEPNSWFETVWNND